jgi:uncharacterized membrane protein YfcA
VLTPILAISTGTRLAVAAVAIPHFIGTLQRFWILRGHVERQVLLQFGITSAVGGLIGAILNSEGSSRGLAILFGAAVALAGLWALTGWLQRFRWGPTAARAAGLLSGLLGGLVGNQGGIRSAGLLGFDVPKESFVATATAIALFVDAARLPVYVATQGAEILALWPVLMAASLAVIVGTAVGTRVLGRLQQRRFRTVVGAALLALGVFRIVGGGGS